MKGGYPILVRGGGDIPGMEGLVGKTPAPSNMQIERNREYRTAGIVL